jgi:GT2 family glycosyltransferase
VTARADVVVPTYRRPESLARLLDALARCRGIEDVQVVVVDDGSGDETMAVVDAAAVPVVYTRQENAGPAAARNRGAALGDAPVVLFVDDDCVPDPDWIEGYLAAFASTPAVAAFGGRISPLVVTPVTRFVQAEGLIDHGRDGNVARFLISANLGVRRAVFDAVGGFDEAFPVAAAEDVDFSLRLRDAGGRLGLLDRAAVAHDHPQTWTEVFAVYHRHGRGRVHLVAAHPDVLDPIDAPRALSPDYWRSRYGRYREHVSSRRAIGYGARRAVGLACMAAGVRTEQARAAEPSPTR